ncbi:MAG: hypothetical protein KKD07_02725 [Candidatus Omnitrophica bacterium]|nr:hypothetical protein [Candidatus Omnitrophota bacterium]
MSLVFNIIAYSLDFISYITGLTYKEINIIVYYMVIPFIYIALIDRISKKHFLKVIFGIGIVMFFLSVKNFHAFSEWFFDASVVFLKSFEQIGWNYVVASVIICVVIPGILFVLLFYYAYRTEINTAFKINNKGV